MRSVVPFRNTTPSAPAASSYGKGAHPTSASIKLSRHAALHTSSRNCGTGDRPYKPLSLTASQKVLDIHRKACGEPNQNAYGGISNATLNLRNVRAIHVRGQCERLLREPSRNPRVS